MATENNLQALIVLYATERIVVSHRRWLGFANGVHSLTHASNSRMAANLAKAS
jgi:hypothetical protein